MYHTCPFCLRTGYNSVCSCHPTVQFNNFSSDISSATIKRVKIVCDWLIFDNVWWFKILNKEIC